MPKHEIDYSNTIIYKITCNDSMVTDLYVGHTTNFVQRKHAHKQSCINEKGANYKCKLYEVIRNNGGWINWKMEIINFFNCKTHYEARKKEQEYFLSLNATLNSIEPYAIPKPKEIVTKTKIIKEVLHCNKCNKYFSNKDLLETHNKTNKHIKKMNITMLTKNSLNSPKQFTCDVCHYTCCKKNDMDKHFNSKKHIRNKNGNNCNNEFVNTELKCINCNKLYKSRVGLWRHKKTCNIDDSIKLPELTLLEKMSNKNDEKINLLINENIDFKNIIIELVKNNSDLQKQTLEMQQQMLDVCKTSGVNNSYNNNKTFNMQVFLNEQCKDAMNIMDFVNSITLDFSDLEELGELGYVEGISRQMVRKLSEMDIYKRPIHCSDLKRETMYVRDDNVWEKETETYENLRKAIKYITKKNGDLMIPWRNAHPQCMNLQHPLNDKYLGIMNQAMGGKGEFAESESKIIKKISKSVKIDKSDFK
jgi:hypothetical protein